MSRKAVLVYPRFLSPLAGIKDFNIPLGLLHLGTFLKSKGFEIRIVDTIVEDYYSNIIKKEMDDALCVGISAMTAQLPHAIEIIKEIKTFNKDMPIVLGGTHPTLFAKQSVENDLIDYAIIGEGELPFSNLLEALSRDEYEQLSTIPGIAYKEDTDEVTVNYSVERFNYSEMPPISYDLLNPIVLEKYIEVDSIYFPLLTARGCPHRCAFCINVILKEYRKYKPWSAERTVTEIKRILELPRKGTHCITFFDENTFVSKQRIGEIVSLIKEEHLNFHWYCSARANYFRDGFLDIPFLKELHNCGMRRISLGIETGSGEVLDYLQKDITLEDIGRAADFCEAANIRPSYSMMIGLPGEDANDVRKTIELIRLLSEKHRSWGIVGPQLFRPYPGSKIYQDCVEAGLYEPESIEEWIEIVKDNNEILDARKMPWIRHPKMVNCVHFYSVLAAASYSKLICLFNEYCDMTKRNFVFRLAGLVGIIALSFIGKIRLRFNFYDLLIEKVIFEKIRRAHISF